nr:hypothetical protein [Bacillus clarus]
MCGLSISLLLMITGRQEWHEKKLQVTLAKETKFATQLTYHKNKWISPALHEFLTIVREHAEKWERR